MEAIRVAIVDDQNLFRQTLSMLIKNIKGFDVVTETATGSGFINYLKVTKELPDLVLLDMNMTGLSGLEINGVLHKEYPSIKVIILSVHAQDRLISQMMQEGVCSYLLKNCNVEELVTAIKTVSKSGFYINEMVLNAIKAVSLSRTKMITSVNTVPVELTNREIEVLQLICKEYSNTEIAEKLFLSARTVEGHRRNLLLKIGCRNTAGLVLFAIKHKIYKMLY